eukprot:jgi/Picsp_1/1322/NSC_04803-R1_riken cdna 2810410a08
MRLKELESLMQDIDPFDKPKIELEQYPTGPHLAARMLYTVATVYDEFESKSVVDLGCGTGMLSIGAAMLGAGHVIGVDVDPDALHRALANMESYEDHLPIDLICSDVSQIATMAGNNGFDKRLTADTVIMNPPFGTRKKGADIEFLRAAFGISQHSIYSLHKTSTREYVRKFALRQMHAVSAEPVAMLRYDLPASYAFHKMASKDVEVDVWRFQVPCHDVMV